MKSHAHTRVLLLALLLAVGLHAFPQSVTPPRFPGGDTGFAGFLFSHLRYPEAMLDSLPHVEGRVLVRITIDTDGYVSRAGIVQSLGYHFDTAALRVVSKMPQWEPARDSLGHPLTMSSTIPIPFFAPKPKSEEEPVPPELVGVSRDPMFPGGEYVMQTFVKDRLAEWPEAKGCGKVTVYFAVNKNGRLSDITYPPNIDEICLAALKNLIEEMPRWEPGLLNGRPQRMSLGLNVQFPEEDEE